MKHRRNKFFASPCSCINGSISSPIHIELQRKFPLIFPVHGHTLPPVDIPYPFLTYATCYPLWYTLPLWTYPTPSGHSLPPGYPIPCYWHLVVIFGDLFKLVHNKTPPMVLTSSGGHRSEWYASYWNAFLFFDVFRFHFRFLVEFSFINGSILKFEENRNKIC